MNKTSDQYLQLSKKDNVATIIKHSNDLYNNIPVGHKFALRDIEKSSPIIKYGHVIGIAKNSISAGEHVHTHNIKMPTEISYKTSSGSKNKLHPKEINKLTTFEGYSRKEGSSGTRNFLLVVATVNCSASVVKKIVDGIDLLLLLEKKIDGIIPITHSQGCAQAIGGLGDQYLNRTLAGWIFHPNVVGTLVVGLGCEVTTINSIIKTKEDQGHLGDTLLDHFNIQDVEGTKKAVNIGIEKMNSIIAKLPAYKRTPQSISNIKLGLNCGGSDAFSALTANPLLGLTSDYLVYLGGTTTLAEIPECNGTEEILINRCIEQEDRTTLKKIFKWWLEYSKKNGVELNNNISPGNIEGGISTIIEKSLGAVTKGGTAPIAQVVNYSEPITKPGFTIMDTPGFDPVSVTGLVAGGCNMIAFTTGRGSTFGSAIAPTIKIATTTSLYKKMSDDMDFNAGTVLSEGHMEEQSIQLLNNIIATASGEKTKSERLNLGSEEFVPWAVGETL